MTKKIKHSLGKGLEAVLGANGIANQDLSNQDIQRELKTVNVYQLIPGKYQPRREFDQELLKELAASIKEQGILQPITVRSMGHEYEIIAGERRWRAAQMAGLQQVPVIVCDINDETTLAFSLIENIQRKDLNPIEEANALQRLIHEFSMTHEQVAKAVGRSRTMVTNMLRLLNLAETLKKMLIEKKLEMGHARSLLALPQEQQIKVANIIIDKNLTVRGAENLVKKIMANKIKKKVKNKSNEFDFKINAWEEEISELLGVMAEIQISRGGEGKVILPFTSLERLQRLIYMLKNHTSKEEVI